MLVCLCWKPIIFLMIFKLTSSHRMELASKTRGWLSTSLTFNQNFVRCFYSFACGSNATVSALRITLLFCLLYFFSNERISCLRLSEFNEIWKLNALTVKSIKTYLKFLNNWKIIFVFFLIGWNVAFDDKRRLCSYGTKKIRDFQILVLDFFLFYSKYNFDVYVMSTHFGCSFIRSNYTYPNFIVGKPMCVAGLLSQNYNCACHVSKKNLSDFINVCNISVEMLNANGF